MMSDEGASTSSMGTTVSARSLSPDSDTSQEVFQINKDPEVILLDNFGSKSRTDSEEIDTEEFQENDRIIMSAIWKNGKFAASYFNIHTSELFVLNEISDSVPEHNMLKNLYRQVRPSMIIVESRSSKTFINTVKSLINENGLTAFFMCDMKENSQTNAGFYLLPSKEYNFENCRNRIYQIYLPNERPNASHHDHEVFLNTVINFRCIQTVHITGALLKYLDKNWCFINTNSDGKFNILAVNNVSLDKIVTMNDETYKALQIFYKLPHPSNFKNGMAASFREGLSLYNTFNKCRSKMGTQYLRILLQNPTRDLKTIQRRLDTIMFLNKPGNEEFIKKLCSSLKYIKNVNGIMTRIKSLRATPYEWKQLFNAVYNAVLICEICENKGGPALITSLGSMNNDNLFQVAHHMNRVIDFEVAIAQGKFTVKPGIDTKLDEKKQVMTGLHGFMSSTAKFELDKLPMYVQECNMVYLPNIGYLLGIKMWKEELNDDEKNIPNLKFMFQNDDSIYYKSEGCDELDDLIGDTYPEILAHEMRIMSRLTHFILQHLHSLSSIVTLCAELDCMISIAKVCKDNDYRRPTLCSERVINIKQGRHPLQEMCVDNFVPNDTNVSNGMVTVLSGPNSCGKSIYLKQIAIIVYLAHIGCFVPAESATIGLVDQIFTRIHTMEDIYTRMSAFLIDLRQMSEPLNSATSNSLIIIDEFGKGTTEVDGLGLLAASINTFLFQEDECPHVFVSTHFHTLKDYLFKSQQLRFMSLEYIIQNEKVVFLYKVIEGMSKESFANKVAEYAGIPKSICSRAEAISERFYEQYPEPDETLSAFITQQKMIDNVKNLLMSDESVDRNCIDSLTD